MTRIKTLNNGLKIVTSEMPYMESAAVGIFVRMGGRYEEKEYSGVSHFIEHMLFKGTERRDTRALKEAIEGVGGHFNGFTAEEVTCYFVKIPSKYASLGLDVLSDMVLNPRFDVSDLEKERNVICEEIKMYKDQPSSYVHELLAETMWPGHPLGFPLAGTEASVMGLDRKALLNLKERSYLPANISVVAAGKFDSARLVRDVKRLFGERRSKRPEKYKKFIPDQKNKAVRLEFKDTEQTHIAMGFHAFGRMSERKYAQNLLNIVLGGNMSSRLFEELREKRGLCYDISTSTKKYDETGAFFIHAGTANDKAEEALSLIIQELKSVKRDGITKDELVRAQEFYKGQLLLALEDTGSRMLLLGEKMASGEGVPDVKKIIKLIDGVTVEDVKGIASKIFKEGSMNMAVIGPKSFLKKMDTERVMVLP